MSDYFVPRSIADVESLIGMSEGPHLDFKSRLLVQDLAKFKRDLPKHCSAFANAGGGVIVIGVDEDKASGVPCACAINGLSPNELTNETIENVLLAGVTPKIPMPPINRLAHSTGDVVVIHIPRSVIGHQSSDRKFYARRLLRADELQRFEIEELFRRRTLQDDDVFVGFIVADGLVMLRVDNPHSFPIFDVRLAADSKIVAALPKRPPPLTTGIRTFPPRSKFDYIISPAHALFGNPLSSGLIDYEVSYRVAPEATPVTMPGAFDLSQLIGSKRDREDVTRIVDAIEGGFTKVAEAIRRVSDK